ncbi:hypothetical protein GSbR_20550 [Geobacter sp. SVR]|nr:hypothetical protein GSVR_17270 [Geobacter sp. SVR]GCF85455.1 hypothetical protein GSbR_20550 [Geobacter sp. SVR]
MVDGNTVGALGVYLLKLKLEGQTSAALVYKTDLEKLEMGELCDRFEVSLDHAILNLKLKVLGRQS